MSADNRIRMHASVEGRVQGVGFRYFVLDKAQPLDITGWVRNRWDGTVEVLAEGSREDVENLLATIRRGPRQHTTSGVKEAWLEATGEFTHFRIRETE